MTDEQQNMAKGVDRTWKEKEKKTETQKEITRQQCEIRKKREEKRKEGKETGNREEKKIGSKKNDEKCIIS